LPNKSKQWLLELMTVNDEDYHNEVW
jgi:hypothetical protein